MEIAGPLTVVISLSMIHLTIGRWRILHGPQAHLWLSTSAGTALAYVFTYLLPKLATIQASLDGSGSQGQAFLRNHAYLLALAGLLTYFALGPSASASDDHDVTAPNRRFSIAFLALGYSFYSLQIGYLIAELNEPDMATFALVGLILGLHLMGIDHHLRRAHTSAYDGVFRYLCVGALFSGWVGGILTEAIKSTVMLSSAFVAGGIIIMAIREEMPAHGMPRPLTFFVAAIAGCAAILLVQSWQAS
jgi:hypothetical protein